MSNNYDVWLESKKFSFMIIDLYKYLISQKEYIISKQLLRSGTSIWANIKESKYGYSRWDFLYKMSLSLKECSETEYRIELLEYWWYLDEYEKKIDLKDKVLELLKVLTKIVKTTRQNNKE